MAQAATRYAEPGMGGSDPTCPQADPCDLETAVESAAGTDEVIVTAGTYSLPTATQIAVPANVNVHGASSQSPPVITTDFANNAVTAINSNSRLADLFVVYTGTANAVQISNNSVGERLHVVSAGSSACNVIGAVLRDSICWDTGASGHGIFNSNGTGIPLTTTLRNVTAVATGTSSNGMTFESNLGLDHTIDARNVIADGTAFDVRAATLNAASKTTINLSNSNYANTDTAGSGTQSVTVPGTDANQTAAPGFVNKALGDFHQNPNSVTVNAGAAAASQLGSEDIDGEARIQGSAPDIGADELTDTSSPPSTDNFPPDTGIRSGPKKKYPKRKVTFEFGGSEPGVTFECSLTVGSRQGTFEPCTSPHRIRGMKRKTKYVFAVRAVDAAGNPDPTPADRRWKVVKKKKK